MTLYEEKYEIRDSVHKFISFNEPEREIINSKVFQRLRRIKQLAFTNMVYPGAEHTRFAHSLGVMKLASQAFDTLVSKSEQKQLLKEYGFSQEELEKSRQIIRFAALLHDTGHAPFSHSGEKDLFPEMKDRKGKVRLAEHEDYSIEIIKTGSIKDIIENGTSSTLQINVGEVISLISKDTLTKYSLWKQLISGSLDVDRMDYLVRDSLHTGVAYGYVDFDRLIRTLTLKEDRGSLSLALEQGGVNAAEGLIYARYAMFTQVYFHKTRRAYDMHLTNFLKGVLDGGKFPTLENLDDYLAWDDFRVMGLLAERVKTNKDADAILNRNHYRLVHDTPDYPKPEETMLFYEIKEEIVKKYFKGNQSVIRVDAAESSPHKFIKEPFFVKGATTGRFHDIMTISDPINNLNPILKINLYVPKGDNVLDIRNFVLKEFKK